MTKIVVARYLNNAGGAGTFIVPAVMMNGITIVGDRIVMPEKAALVRIACMSAVGTWFLFSRMGHTANPVVLPTLYDSGGDYEQHINLEEMLREHGIAVDAGEMVQVSAALTGNGTVYVFEEYDTEVPGVNCFGIRVQGSAAMVAGTPVESGGNLRLALFSPLVNYTPVATYFHSTTAIRGSLGLTSQKLVDIRGHTGVVLGHKMDVLTPKQQSLLTAPGSMWTNLSLFFGSATAADAANTQFLYVLFALESLGGKTARW